MPLSLLSRVKNLSNGQFIIQGQFQIHFHSSLINNFKNIKNVRTSLARKLSQYMYESKQQFSFEVFDNFSKVYGSVKDLECGRMYVDPNRLHFMFD